VYLGSSSENDSGIMQIAAAGSRRPLLLRGHYCASSDPTNCQWVPRRNHWRHSKTRVWSRFCQPHHRWALATATITSVFLFSPARWFFGLFLQGFCRGVLKADSQKTTGRSQPQPNVFISVHQSAQPRTTGSRCAKQRLGGDCQIYPWTPLVTQVCRFRVWTHWYHYCHGNQNGFPDFNYRTKSWIILIQTLTLSESVSPGH